MGVAITIFAERDQLFPVQETKCYLEGLVYTDENLFLFPILSLFEPNV